MKELEELGLMAYPTKLGGGGKEKLEVGVYLFSLLLLKNE